MAFFEFAHIFWETTKPANVLTVNKSLTRFIQTKYFPPSLRSACDNDWHFTFKKAHISGSVNTAADLFSRLVLELTEKICLKIREDIQKTPIQVTTSSSDVADENNSSSPKQTTSWRHKDRPFNKKINPGNMQKIG